MKKILFLAVILMMIMSSCAAPVEVPIPTNEVQAPTDKPLQTATPTLTLTPEPTSTITPTPTLTPEPVYTEFGELAFRLAEVLGWEVIICDSSIVEEDWDKGVFRYREDVDYYFCGYDGYSSEPVLQPTETNYQYVLSLTLRGGYVDASETDFKTILLFMMYGLDARYYIPYPSEITADKYISEVLKSGESLDEYRSTKVSYNISVRMWPLKEEEFTKISNDPLLAELIHTVYTSR